MFRCSLKSFRLFSVLFGLFIVQPAWADPIVDPPPETAEETAINSAHNSLLRQGKYDQLNREMTQIQHEYEQGARTDISLLHLFRAFYDNDGSLLINFDAWVAAYPQSYVAHEARGIYFRRLAYAARGSNYINQTPEQQVEIMNDSLGKAVKDFQLSLKQTAKPLLTYYDILSIAKLWGDRSTAGKMLNLACAIDPKNFIVRYKYMLMLEGRWGGSLAQMQAFRAEAKSAGLPDDQLRYLDDLLSDETVWLRENSTR